MALLSNLKYSLWVLGRAFTCTPFLSSLSIFLTSLVHCGCSFSSCVVSKSRDATASSLFQRRPPSLSFTLTSNSLCLNINKDKKHMHIDIGYKIQICMLTICVEEENILHTVQQFNNLKKPTKKQQQ